MHRRQCARGNIFFVFAPRFAQVDVHINGTGKQKPAVTFNYLPTIYKSAGRVDVSNQPEISRHIARGQGAVAGNQDIFENKVVHVTPLSVRSYYRYLENL